ncbi:MAG: hypothetical protein COB66_08735 [Coxiella sp. (in: Bacteria)]|nr:MAG: hypothetical protein COB66_08735 [Coxiella sp. (in: g-proteobacteria)]
MSIKKLLVLSAAGLAAAASTVAFAGGPDDMGPPVDHFTPSIYVEANAGYSFADWKRLIENTDTIWANSPTTMKSGEEGGFAGGLDVGFNIYKHLAVELGGYWLPYVKGTSNGSAPPTSPSAGSSKGNQNNFMAYLAAKFSFAVPYVDGLDVFTKVGAMWRGMGNGGMPVSSYGGLHDYWNVIYGAGFGYDIMHSGFTANLQWMHMPGYLGGSGQVAAASSKNSKEIASRQPVADMVTLGIGYKFDL